LERVNSAIDQINQNFTALEARVKALEAEQHSQVQEKRSPQPESTVNLRKKLAETEAKLADIQKRRLETEAFWQDQYTKLYETVKGKIPAMHIWKAWRPGCQMMVQELLKVLREFRLPESQSRM
jgi:septal ring factor EnvC (AmiA/AmiB activator)